MKYEKEELLKLRDKNLKNAVLGRYPFQGGIKYYVAKRSAFLRPSTISEEEKKLRYFAKVFEELKTNGLVQRTDPRYISGSDVAAFFEWMQKKDLDVVARQKYVQILNHYLMIFGNNAIDRIRVQDGIRLPRSSEAKPIRTLSTSDLRRIFTVAESMEGWNGIIIRGVISILFSSGCRPKEVLQAKTEDLRMDIGSYGTFYVRHPKGEGSYASAQDVRLIRGDMKGYILDFLRDRNEYLSKAGLSLDYLFPNLETGLPLTSNSIRRYKDELAKRSGVSFKLKDFRSTLASMVIKGDITRMKAASCQLRHSSIRTTERYYAAIERGKIIDDIVDVWKEDPIR